MSISVVGRERERMTRKVETAAIESDTTPVLNFSNARSFLSCSRSLGRKYRIIETTAKPYLLWSSSIVTGSSIGWTGAGATNVGLLLSSISLGGFLYSKKIALQIRCPYSRVKGVSESFENINVMYACTIYAFELEIRLRLFISCNAWTYLGPNACIYWKRAFFQGGSLQEG